QLADAKEGDTATCVEWHGSMFEIGKDYLVLPGGRIRSEYGVEINVRNLRAGRWRVALGLDLGAGPDVTAITVIETFPAKPFSPAEPAAPTIGDRVAVTFSGTVSGVAGNDNFNIIIDDLPVGANSFALPPAVIRA